MDRRNIGQSLMAVALVIGLLDVLIALYRGSGNLILLCVAVIALIIGVAMFAMGANRDRS